VKRGWNARVKAEVDSMATDTSELGTKGQYEPEYIASNFATTTTADTVTLKGEAKNPSREINRETGQHGKQAINY